MTTFPERNSFSKALFCVDLEPPIHCPLGFLFQNHTSYLVSLAFSIYLGNPYPVSVAYSFLTQAPDKP